MGRSKERTVGERGQVTLPKELRDKLGIHGGDKVLVHEEDGKITIEKPVSYHALKGVAFSVDSRSNRVTR